MDLRMTRFLSRFPSRAGALLLMTLAACSSSRSDAVAPVLDAGVVGADGSVAPITCGQPGALCSGAAWCAYALVGTCGNNGQLTGTCTARPTSCAENCPLVCGCDGHPYCNACAAQVAGTDVASGRGCVPPGGEFSAFMIPAAASAPAKIVIFEKDTTRMLCVEITLSKRADSLYGVRAPDTWGVENAIVTDSPDDCVITSNGTPRTPTGTTTVPGGGEGTITFSPETSAASALPCKLSIDARLAFAILPEWSWVPNVESLTATDVTVNGACE